MYLALEGVEKSFMLRNYGTRDGELYKPDSMEMGGGKSSSSSFGGPSSGGWPGSSGTSNDGENDTDSAEGQFGGGFSFGEMPDMAAPEMPQR